MEKKMETTIIYWSNIRVIYDLDSSVLTGKAKSSLGRGAWPVGFQGLWMQG